MAKAKTYSEEKKALLHRAAEVMDVNPEAVKVDLLHTVDGLDVHFKIPLAAVAHPGSDQDHPYRQAVREVMHAASALIVAGHNGR